MQRPDMCAVPDVRYYTIGKTGDGGAGGFGRLEWFGAEAIHCLELMGRMARVSDVAHATSRAELVSFRPPEVRGLRHGELGGMEEGV